MNTTMVLIDVFFSKQVELEAATKDPGTTLRAPTVEAGLAPTCKDTCFAELRLRIWDRKSDGGPGNVSPLLGLCYLYFCNLCN